MQRLHNSEYMLAVALEVKEERELHLILAVVKAAGDILLRMDKGWLPSYVVPR